MHLRKNTSISPSLKRFQLSSAIPSISCSFDYIHNLCSGEKFAREPWCFQLGRARDGIGYALAIQQKPFTSKMRMKSGRCRFAALIIWLFQPKLTPEVKGLSRSEKLKVDAKGQHIPTWWSLLAVVISKGTCNYLIELQDWLISSLMITAINCKNIFV